MVVKKGVVTFSTFKISDVLTVSLTYLVQQECAMTRHSSSVVHDCRDVAEKINTSFTDLVVCE